VPTVSVLAIEYGGFGGRPAYPREDNPRTESIFVHTIEPGNTVTDGVKVVNNTAEAKTMMVYAADSTRSTGGAFACEQFSESKDEVGAWINLTKSEVTLEPSTSEVIDFTITVPAAASVGEHNGCVLIQEKKVSNPEKAGVNLSVRTGLRVVVTIPGETVRKLGIVNFTSSKKDNGSVILRPQVKNSGTVSIDANISVSTRSWFGKLMLQQGGQYPILRNETSEWNFEFKPPFWGGWYKSHLSVEYDADAAAGVGVKSGKALTKLEGPTIWFFTMPSATGLAIEALILLVLIIIIAGLCLQRRRRRWIHRNWQHISVDSNDSIQSLAKEFDVSWKLLAKVNKLKPPYGLKTGDKIKVPPRGR